MATHLEEFFTTVGQLRILLDQLSRHVDEVQRRQGAILSDPNRDQRNKDELEKLNNEVKKDADFIRTKLKSMQSDVPVEENISSVVRRIHQNQLSHLTLCFSDIMRHHHVTQTSFREKCRAQIERQLTIVNKVMTDEELEEMLNRDDLGVFFTSQVSCDAAVSSQTLSQIKSRHQDIIRLESAIKELHEVFMDTAALLDGQGDLINNIEKNVTSAVEFVDQSKAETHRAITFKKNRYKIASLPDFLKSSKRETTKTQQKSAHLYQN